MWDGEPEDTTDRRGDTGERPAPVVGESDLHPASISADVAMSFDQVGTYEPVDQIGDPAGGQPRDGGEVARPLRTLEAERRQHLHVPVGRELPRTSEVDRIVQEEREFGHAVEQLVDGTDVDAAGSQVEIRSARKRTCSRVARDLVRRIWIGAGFLLDRIAHRTTDTLPMMDLKEKLIRLAREATGDDAITVAGDFQPKGMTWKVATASVAGSTLGSAVGGDVGQSIGTAAGFSAGRYAASSGELPPVIVLAASPDKLYLMTSNNAKGIILAKHLVLLDTLERKNLSVEMHQKMSVRTAVITDSSTGHEYKIEGKRILFHHMNDMLDALGVHDADDAEHDTAVLTD
jgi:hypothetical protein